MNRRPARAQEEYENSWPRLLDQAGFDGLGPDLRHAGVVWATASRVVNGAFRRASHNLKTPVTIRFLVFPLVWKPVGDSPCGRDCGKTAPGSPINSGLIN